MATAINVNGRKRPLPSTLVDDSSAPPNKKIELPMEKEMREKQKREKELLHQRVAEASKSPFFLQPRIMPSMPMQRTGLVHTPGLSNLGMPAMYPLLQSPVSTGRLSTSSGSRTPIPATPSPGASAGIGVTRPLSAPFYPPLMGYSPQPFKPSPGFSCFPAWSPLHNGIASPAGAGKSAQKPAEGAGSSRCEMTTTRNGCSKVMPVASSTCSTTTVTTTVSSSNSTQCTSTTTHSIGMTQSLTGILPYVISPHSSLPSIQSPFSFYHHQASPISPMMFLNSPYANSCPSVSSSSGCSSMSDGSSIVQNFTNGKHVGGIRIAPSEYHVGIRPPISVGHGEAESDDGCGSDRAPSPDEEDPDQIPATVDSSIAACTIVKSTTVKEPSTQQHQPRPTNQAANEVDYPLSVQSLTSSDKSSQSYLSGCQLPCSVERPSSGVSSMSSCASSRESSPEPDAEDADLLVMEHKPDLCSSGGSETFVLVPGRLSLLSATQKYKVSVDEVRRRLSHPECLNASVLGGILRRAKSKNGGHLLRQRLESIGLSLPPGRRKATELSLLTSLVEGEAEHLSRDFRRICDNYFPHQELAQIIGRQHVGTPQAQERVSMVKATQVVLSELQAMINAVGGPNNIRPTDPNNPYPGLTNFSLITHGFGNPAMDTMFSVVQTYLHELLAIYEGRVPIQANPQSSSSHGSSGSSRAGSSRGHASSAAFQTGLSLKQEPVDLH